MPSTVQDAVAVAAQWLPPLVVVAAAVAGMMLPRTVQVRVAVQAVVALVLAVLAVKVAGAVHVDPRPFVVDPALHPSFAHTADNGFPSDHTTFAVAAGATLLAVRRRTGVVLVVLGTLGGLARVAAHVHHVQDVAGGLLLGLLAAGLAAPLAARVMEWGPLRRLDGRWRRTRRSSARVPLARG